MTSKAAKVWKRTWVGGSLALVTVLLLWRAHHSENGLVVWVGGAALATGCVFEVSRLERLVPRNFQIPLIGGLLAALSGGALRFAGVSSSEGFFSAITDYPSGRGVLASYVLGAAVALLLWLYGRALRRGRGGWREGALLAFLSLWLLAPLPALAQIWKDFGPEGLVALILLSKIGDVFGYYVGNAIGKTHPFKRISPGKTTAGCVASLVAGGAAGLTCVPLGLLPEESGLVAGLLAGVLVNLAAQSGDLLESVVKRRAQIKDSGTWFGPSGGVLDLVDSLLLSIPTALLSWPLLLP